MTTLGHGERTAIDTRGERPWEKPALPAPRSQTSHFQKREEVNLCCLSRPGCSCLNTLPQNPPLLLLLPPLPGAHISHVALEMFQQLAHKSEPELHG